MLNAIRKDSKVGYSGCHTIAILHLSAWDIGDLGLKTDWHCWYTWYRVFANYDVYYNCLQG